MTRFLQDSSTPDLPGPLRASQEDFERLYLKHYDQVYQFILSRIQNALDAEDLAQDVFLRAWVNLARYVERGIPYNHYLLRIASNIIIDYYRRGTFSVPLEDDAYTDPRPDPEETALLSIDLHNLASFLEKLPEDYREVLVLHYLTGLTTNEIARLINRSHSATRSLQHRALMAMRSLSC